MHRPSTVAIVILNYNGKHYLQQFLPFVFATTYPQVEIVVGDNASTDGSVAWLAETYPSVTIISNKENYGFAKGYNEVLQHVAADIFVLLNSDVEVTAGWVEPIVRLMENEPSIGACQPKMLSYHNRSIFEYAGAAGGWIDALGYPFARGRVFETCEIDNGQYDNIAQVFWASGAAFFCRAQVFKKLGGFDEYFFAHQEEIDLCWRMQSAGYSIMVCPQSAVYHVGGGTLPASNRKVYLNFRNNLVMLAKNLPPLELLWKLPVRMLLDAVAAWQKLLSGNGGFFLSVAKAHFAFISWMFQTSKTLRLKPVAFDLLQGVYKGSVVYNYFVKKNKTFAEIVTESG